MNNMNAPIEFNVGDPVRAIVPHSNDHLETFNGIVSDRGHGLVEILLSNGRTKAVAEKYVHRFDEDTPPVKLERQNDMVETGLNVQAVHAKLMNKGLDTREILQLVNYIAFLQETVNSYKNFDKALKEALTHKQDKGIVNPSSRDVS